MSSAMNLKISQHDENDDLAKVSTDDMEALTDDAYINKESGDLHLGYEHTATVKVKISDASVAHNAMNAVRRAIKYGETWKLGDE